MATDPSRFSDRIDQGLFNAIAEGKLDLVKSYADQGANLYRTMDPEGRQNPLRLAAIRGQFDIVKFLVEEKHVKPGKDARVMHMVIMADSNYKDMFTYLAQHGGNVNAFDPILGTPLMMAMHDGGNEEKIKFLVEDMHADIAFVAPNQNTAMHAACEMARPEIVKYLLDKDGKERLTAKNDAGFTPLVSAASKGRDDVVRMLVKDNGVHVDDGADVNALFMAVQHRHISTVRLLVELGANVNAVHAETQATALHLAASNNFLDIVDILLAGGAHVDCEDPRGYTPLLMAGTEGYTTCVRKLLEAGADVTHRAHSDMATAIFHCANKNRVEVVRVLLEYGANPLDTRTEENETLEEVARKEGRHVMANLLHAWIATATDPSERVKICHRCCKYEHGAQKRCTRCKTTWYCSPDCQKADWPEHKFKCKPPRED